MRKNMLLGMTVCALLSFTYGGNRVAAQIARGDTPSQATQGAGWENAGNSPDSNILAPAIVPVTRHCPPEPKPRIVEIRKADPNKDKWQHDQMRRRLIEEVSVANTTVLLGPNVVLDFSDANEADVPLRFGPCVTLTSVSTFGPDTILTGANVTAPNNGNLTDSPLTVTAGPRLPPARTPQSLGPLLRYDPKPHSDNKAFLSIKCAAGELPADNIRISEFRIHGPDFGQQQETEDFGIKVDRCLNIEISNMEIAGWGGAAIRVVDDSDDLGRGSGQEQPNNRPGERIGRASQIRIFNNYIHHNQHPRGTPIFGDNHAAGYGVDVHHGAWAQIYQNVFDSNRHAIAASGKAGGYEALRNLVLKGGGVHYDPLDIHTHQFDIHGTGNNGFGGQAGVQFEYANNAFQYRADNAIAVRGRPFRWVDIHDNVFPHDGLEDDWGDDAIKVENRSDLDVIRLGPRNVINFDSYGRYGVCDFDGDTIDDLFLATGKTWWYSSSGEFPWTYLSAQTEHLNQVRLGYFDNDNRCDVLTENDGEWVISSGGTGSWESIGAFGAPLSEVDFGRFDPRIRDHRRGINRRTTHAFWRTQSGQWQVTPLSTRDWHNVQSSSLPMNMLRFGDFTGDGVTDVLAVRDGRWSISDSGTGRWQRLNEYLDDDVRSLFIADLNNNNIDDLIRLERVIVGFGGDIRFTWFVSDDGRSRWRKLTSYTLRPLGGSPIFAYAGRFGVAPGGGVLLIDQERVGHFFSEAEGVAGASPSWTSRFSY